MKKINPVYSILFVLIFSSFLISCKTSKNSTAEKSSEPASLAMDPKYRQLHETFMDGIMAKTMGNIDKASQLFQSCLVVDPENAAAMYELAQIYAQKELRSEAVKMAENASKIEPKNEWYLYLHAQLLQQYSRYSEASAVYEKLLKIQPDKTDYILESADNYVMAGKFSDALKAYDLVEKKMGVMEMISLQKQKIYIHLGKLDKAVTEIEKLIRQFPSEARYYSLLADLYMASGQEKKAAETFEKALKVNPDEPYIHLALYDFYLKTGDKGKAQNELLSVFAFPDIDLDTKIQILLAYFSIGHGNTELNQQAYDLISVLKKTHPDNPKVYSIEGDFLYRDQKPEEALLAFKKVISLDSSRYVVWEQLIRIEGELERYSEVLDICKRAIDLFPEQPIPYMFAGISNVQLKDYEEAIRYFKQCQQLIVDNDDLLSNVFTFLGDAYYQVKNHTLSDENYEKALKIRYDNPYVLNNYSYYLSVRGEKLEKAEKMAKRAVEMEPLNATYLDTYAWVLYKAGRYQEAAVIQEKALQNKGASNPVLLEHYGDILYRLNRTVEAMEYWKKAQSAGKASEFLDSKILQNKLIE